MTGVWSYIDTHPTVVIAGLIVGYLLALFGTYFAGVALGWWDGPSRTPKAGA